MPEVIVLDTHIWLWLIHGNFDRFPSHWLAEFLSATRLGVSTVSCYELALAVRRGRIILSRRIRDWFEIALAPAGIELLSLDENIAARAVELSPVHKDPFDRLIIATALEHGGQLASIDSTFARYPELDNCLMR